MSNELPKKESLSLRFLYHTAVGRLILKLLTAPAISKICGCFLDSRLSKPMIKSFVKKNGIDLSEYESTEYSCFNDFFTRKIKDGMRPVPEDKEAFIAPCDGLLSVYEISGETVIPVKQSMYTVNSLLGGDAVSERYSDGLCLVFRLCVNHYHRYCYIDNAEKVENVFIKGKLHTVRPIALENSPVFTQNSREYTVMSTENFGKITQIEVGALLVGKIKNLHGKASVRRGEEKGMFLYGGSTVIVLVENGKVKLKDGIADKLGTGTEIPVKQGDVLGIGVKKDQ